ncbi:MAG: T9SS type A sorting domain-containing protein [Saprospiraceae bacterium]|nr:T9SS type A sorting domain-containing protein [Saprospiraceae bacterium]
MKITFTLFILIYYSFLHSQSNFVSAGGDVKNSTGSISSSIGPWDYLTIKSNSGTISQGIQQSYLTLSTPYEDGMKEIEITIMPNPTINFVNLTISKFTPLKYQYSIFDIKGVLIQQSKITDKSTRINLESLPASTYLLQVNNNQRTIKTFKIIKTN